jgi:hypothetical protein
MDRYTKTVLTVIAGALVYLCIVMTAFPTVHAQQTAARPGEMTGPAPVVIVGWRTPETVPVAVHGPVSLNPGETVHIVGSVTTERSTASVDRMVIAGWEENAAPGRPGSVHALSGPEMGVPVVIHQR